MSNQVEAKVIACSISPDGSILTTIEGTFHRFTLSEVNKHRSLSNSAQSSRAVPVKKMVEMVRNNPMQPLHWGKNQPGMVADEELEGQALESAKFGWKYAANRSASVAEFMDLLGVHKQIVNRVLEPYLPQKIVITGTHWGNFFKLRLHKDAQPEIKAFAQAILDAMNSVEPTVLRHSEWHLPYVQYQRFGDNMRYFIHDTEVDLDTAKKWSAARCATTSYRTEIVSIEKGLEIYDKLVVSEPQHSVPLEHVARPLLYAKSATFGYDDLTTHITRDGWCWSGNFCGWGQMRKEIEGAYL